MSQPANGSNDPAELHLPGTVVRVIWCDQATGYAVAAVAMTRDSEYFCADECPPEWAASPHNVVVTGRILSDLNRGIGKPMVFVGASKRHPKYGLQMDCAFTFVDVPSSAAGMVAYLSTMPHVGKHRATRIVEMFGIEHVGRVIEESPERLVRARIGLTAERADALRRRWVEDRDTRRSYLWFSQHGVSLDIAKRAISKFGKDVLSVVQSDPYRLVEVKGIGFKTADEVAHKVLPTVDPARRTLACVTHVLEDALASGGHLCMPVASVCREAMTLMSTHAQADVYRPLVSEALSRDDLFVVDPPGFAYLKGVHAAESRIAAAIAGLASRPPVLSLGDDELLAAEGEIARASGRDLRLDELQRTAVRSAFSSRLTVVTGGGGTGKSTICRCICTAAARKGLAVRLMAPTGKAAKVLSVKTGFDAHTIHMSLRMKPGEEAEVKIGQDIVVVDEFSMCGLDTVGAICKCLPDDLRTHLVLVGDSQQLPSVTPGNFLADIIKSGVANVVRLERIYRQDEHSYITLVADGVAKGVPTEIPPEASDIKMQRVGDGPEAVEMVCDILRRSNAEKGIDFSDMHVLSSMHKGDCGVSAMNFAVQRMVAEMRGSPPHMSFGGMRVFVGDKLMQVENNYGRGVFNGDVGVVQSVGRRVFDPDGDEEPYVAVTFQDPPRVLTYRGDDVDELMLSWCTTVHKFQGSQCKYVLFVMPSSHAFMLTKELVYTAITRAEKKVIVVGDPSQLRKCPRRTAAASRHTLTSSKIASAART